MAPVGTTNVPLDVNVWSVGVYADVLFVSVYPIAVVTALAVCPGAGFASDIVQCRVPVHDVEFGIPVAVIVVDDAVGVLIVGVDPAVTDATLQEYVYEPLPCVADTTPVEVDVTDELVALPLTAEPLPVIAVFVVPMPANVVPTSVPPP